VGTPLELYGRPQNLFVARFIGTPPMNILNGTVNEAGDKVLLADIELPLVGPQAEVGQRYRGKEICVGIRPEHVDAIEGEGRVYFEAEMDVVEPLGHEVVAYTHLGGTRLVAKLVADHIPEFGEVLRLGVRYESLHLFDPETEERLN